MYGLWWNPLELSYADVKFTSDNKFISTHRLRTSCSLIWKMIYFNQDYWYLMTFKLKFELKYYKWRKFIFKRILFSLFDGHILPNLWLRFREGGGMSCISCSIQVTYRNDSRKCQTFGSSLARLYPILHGCELSGQSKVDSRPNLGSKVKFFSQRKPLSLFGETNCCFL